MRKIAFSVLFLCLISNLAIADISTIVLQPGPADGKDSMVSGAVPNLNYSPSTGNYFGTFERNQALHDGIYNTNHSFAMYQFGMPSVLTGQEILSATFEVYICNNVVNTSGATGYKTLGANRITSSWDEWAVTWNTRPSEDASVIDYSNNFYGYNTWASFDVTNFVEGWVSNPGSNYGMYVKDPWTTYYSYTCLQSSDYSNATYRPKLTITYNVVPEPCSMILFTVGGSVLFLRRRIRK